MSEIIDNQAKPGPAITLGTLQRRDQAVIVLGAMLGNMASVNTLMGFTIGVFISAFEADGGWSRTATALAMTWFTMVVFLGTALVGRVADHVHPGRLAAISMVAFGGALLWVPSMVHSPLTLWFAYALLATLGLGTSPAVLNKPVIAAFSHGRGRALGVALTGVGLGAFVGPVFTTALVTVGGWRLGYIGLGAFAILTAPVVWLTLGRIPIVGTRISANSSVGPGLSFRDATRTRAFWLLSAIALFAGLGVSGPAAHLIPFLREHLVTPARAASIAALLGLASIVGRLVAGFSLDRAKGPVIGLFLIGAGSAGITLLVLSGIHISIVSVLLLGFTIGAEIDLLAYFVSRFFGLRAHASLFGWTYGMVSLGAAIGPVSVGLLRDHGTTYVLGLGLSGVAVLVAASLCPLLGRYRYSVTLNEEGEGPS